MPHGSGESSTEPVGDCGSLVALGELVSSKLIDRWDSLRACHCSTSLPICALARAAASADMAGAAAWARRRGREAGAGGGVCAVAAAALRGRPRAMGVTPPPPDFASVMRCSDLNSAESVSPAGGGLISRGGVNRICCTDRRTGTRPAVTSLVRLEHCVTMILEH